MFGRPAKREQQSQRELWLLNNQARGRELGERLAGEESPRGQSPGARSAGGDRWVVASYLFFSNLLPP